MAFAVLRENRFKIQQRIDTHILLSVVTDLSNIMNNMRITIKDLSARSYAPNTGACRVESHNVVDRANFNVFGYKTTISVTIKAKAQMKNKSSELENNEKGV